MLKKVVKFQDFNGVDREETLYFNMTEPELMMFQTREKGGMDKFIKEAVDSDDQGRIFDLFEKVLLMSYGEKSADGMRFVKNDELKERFKSSAAYSALFMEICSEPDSATKFINGVCNR